MGRAERYIITIADDDRGLLDKMRQRLIAADAPLRRAAQPNPAGLVFQWASHLLFGVGSHGLSVLS